MTYYLKKTWGFEDPSGPLSFSEKGFRDSAREILEPGDLVVIVGTLNEPTPPDERGKILGLMEPTATTVSALDFQLPDERTHPHHYDENGRYRWPYGLEIKAAWRFPQPLRDFKEVTERTLTREGVLGIFPLLPEEEQQIAAMPRYPAALDLPIVTAVRRGGNAARRMVAPVPTTQRRGVMHMRRFSAYTYAMRAESEHHAAYKIGWAFDVQNRLRQFNQASLPELGGVRYSIELQQLWPTAMEAFLMEQALLRKFQLLRQPFNIEVIAPLLKTELEESWQSYVTDRAFKRKM